MASSKGADSSYWTRIEPQRNQPSDLSIGLQARIHDPLWMLTRQWQVGEFRAEDAGSPVSVRARLSGAPIYGFRPGPAQTAPGVSPPRGIPYNPERLPLEVLVEREEVATANRRSAAELGLNFFRLLEHRGVGGYRAAYLKKYPLLGPDGEDATAWDASSRRYLKVMAGRAPDGHRLYADLLATLRPLEGAAELPREPAISAVDRDELMTAARSFLETYRTFYSTPRKKESSWIPGRLEYGFAVSAHADTGELVLEAPEYVEGYLDWESCDLREGATLGVPERRAPFQVARTVIPSPVEYRGMPADRWWEMEDADVSFGSETGEETDLLRLPFLEFSMIYGTDWFQIPTELEVGAVYKVSSLVVTDSFGQRQLIRSYAEVDGPHSPWRVFCPSIVAPDGRAKNSGGEELLTLLPTLGRSLQGAPEEKLSLFRDEMANLAWAVETRVPNVSGGFIERGDVSPPEGPDELQGDHAAELRYRLAGEVPEHWYPLLPRMSTEDGSSRLVRGRMLREGHAEPRLTSPAGRLLNFAGSTSLYEEEVSEEGIEVTRAPQYARWADGSTHLWVGRKKTPAGATAASGLTFDEISENLSFDSEGEPEETLPAGGRFGFSKFAADKPSPDDSPLQFADDD